MDNNDGWVKVLMWIGVGFVVAWILIPKQTTQSAGSTSCATRQAEKGASPLFGWKPLSEMQILGYEQIPVESGQEQELGQEVQETGITTYKNSEKWKVKRDPDTGRIIGYEVDRNAKVG